MKTALRATIVASIVMLAGSPVLAQQGMNVALLDVGYIFKNHPGFKQQMESMKSDVQSFEQSMKQKQTQIQAAGQQIGTLKPGSADYKKLERETTEQLANLKVEMQLKRKEIMESEAKIYLATYKQVTAAVAAFANAKNIDLVLRYDRESSPTSPDTDPQTTLKIINRPVIFEKGLDISDAILRQVGGVARAGGTPRRQ